jgi:hypothetical protein
MYMQRQTVLPNDDVPVYLSTRLIFFLKCARMNVYYSFIGSNRRDLIINLMDYFPTMRDGYALKYAVLITLFNYVTMNNLAVYPRPSGCILDARLVKAFKLDIINFCDVDETETNPFNLSNSGYVNQKLKLSFLNYIRDNHCVVAPLRNTMRITHESYLAQDLNRLFYNLFQQEYLMFSAPKPIISMSELSTLNLQTLIVLTRQNRTLYLRQQLSNDKRIKLFYAIIIQDTEMVREYVDEIDARNYGYEAYHLALKSNREILDIVTKSIILRNWYEIQVLTSGIEKLVGRNNIPMIIHEYTRDLFS